MTSERATTNGCSMMFLQGHGHVATHSRNGNDTPNRHARSPHGTPTSLFDSCARIGQTGDESGSCGRAARKSDPLAAWSSCR